MTAFVPFQSDAAAVWEYLTLVHGNLAFDIGANGGRVSRKLAEHFDTVIACEPAVESYAELVGEAPTNVRTLNVAVSDVTGDIELRETTITAQWGELFTDGSDSLPWGGHVGYRTVEAVTLDDLSLTYGLPDFIKIDTEGHEVKILQGGGDTLRSDPCFVIEVHSKPKGLQTKHILDSYGLEYEVRYHDAYRETNPAKYAHYWLTSPESRLR